METMRSLNHPERLWSRITTGWSGVALLMLAMALSSQAKAENGYEWTVSYIPGWTWHDTPDAALDEYIAIYEVTAGCITSQCKCEKVFMVPFTWPRYQEKIQCWQKDGKVTQVSTGYVRAQLAGPVKYYVSDRPPPDAQCNSCSNGAPQGDPIDPTSGAVVLSATDVSEGAAGLKFSRFYSSAMTDGSRLGLKWRHSYSRRVNTKDSPYDISPPPGGVLSSLYDDPTAACTQGFNEIRSSISNWVTATAAFANNKCEVSSGGVVMGSIPIYRTAYPAPIPGSAYEIERDDGQRVRFPLVGSSYVAPPGIELKFELNGMGGFKVTDGNDNVENYSADGKLLSVVSRGGKSITLTYSTQGARLTQISDNFGSKVTLTYNPANQLTGVVDSNNQSVLYGYDTDGRLSTVRQTDLTTKTYFYEDVNFPNAVTKLEDELAQQHTTWTYDTQGRAIATSEAGGANAHSLVYNADNTVTVTDALGAVRVIHLERRGDRLVVGQITGSRCPTCRELKATTYDLNSFVATRRDYNDNLVSYAHDARGLETSRTEALGTSQARTITTAWHANFRVPTSIAEPNRTTSFTHDAYGNALTRTVTDTSVSPTESRTWTYTYNSFGQVLTENGPRTDVSDVTTYAYYTCITGVQCGQLNTITNALGQVTTYNSYNAHGQPTQITDANGLVTSLAYDLRQRLTDRCVGAMLPGCASGELTHLDYWPTGLLKKVTTPDASYIEYTYDAAHRLTEIRDGALNKIVYTLDNAGNRTAENTYDPSNALRRTHTRVFNALNQLWKDVNAAGTANVTTTFGYDNNGNQTTISAPLARNSTSVYDELNRLKQITDPASGITQFGFDANDNLTSVTDPRSLATSYTYSGFGDLKTQTSPDTGLTTNTYDSGGNLDTSTDSRGVVTDYDYDVANRVTSASFTLGGVTDQTISYGYDAGTNQNGRLTSASDANHTLAWTYDAQGRVTGKGQTVGAATLAMGYGYNSAGQLGNMQLPSGANVVFGYNANGQVTSLTLNGSTLLNAITYDPFGPITSWTWGNGTAANRAFDTDGKITQVDNAAGLSLKDYAYDDAFRITGITDAVDNTQSWSYGYDLLDRLNSASKTGTTQGWSYDSNGNRLAETGTAPNTFTNSGTSNRVSSISGSLPRNYAYDDAGNTLSYSGTSFTYNNRGRMTTASNAGVTANYVYNALGQRVSRAASGVMTLYAYDEAGHLVGEYTAAGALIQETVWLGDIPVATLRLDGAGGVILYYVHADHLNSPRLVTDTSNYVRWRWESDPFGTTAPDENPAGLGAFAYHLRFPGQQYDPLVGLHYNYFRNYDPAVGGYTQSDPIGLRGGINTYGYVSANPVMRIDPRGLAGTIPRVGPPGLVIPEVAIPGAPANDAWVRDASRAIDELLNPPIYEKKPRPKDDGDDHDDGANAWCPGPGGTTCPEWKQRVMLYYDNVTTLEIIVGEINHSNRAVYRQIANQYNETCGLVAGRVPDEIVFSPFED
jgi:RHS repeat-associated protein